MGGGEGGGVEGGVGMETGKITARVRALMLLRARTIASEISIPASLLRSCLHARVNSQQKAASVSGAEAYAPIYAYASVSGIHSHSLAGQSRFQDARLDKHASHTSALQVPLVVASSSAFDMGK